MNDTPLPEPRVRTTPVFVADWARGDEKCVCGAADAFFDKLTRLCKACWRVWYFVRGGGD